MPGLIPPRQRGHSGRFITDVLVELGYVTTEQVDRAISESRAAGRSPEDQLLGEGIIDADQLSRAIAERYGLDYVDLNIYQVDMAAANLVSVSSARRTRAVPVGHVDKETLLLAMADPANVLAVDDIQMATGLNCRVAVAAPEDIEALIARLNTLSTAVSEAVDEADQDEEEAEITDLRASAGGRSGDQAGLQRPRARRSTRAPPISTSSPRRTRCGFASASTAFCARRPGCRSGWSRGWSRGSRS